MPVSWNVNICFHLKIPTVDWVGFGDMCVRVCPAHPISLCVSMVFAADELTISVSDTGPKLVTKIFVLISVTFSVGRAQLRVSEVWKGHKKAMKMIIIIIII